MVEGEKTNESRLAMRCTTFSCGRPSSGRSSCSILPYNRLVKDLNGQSKDVFLAKRKQGFYRYRLSDITDAFKPGSLGVCHWMASVLNSHCRLVLRTDAALEHSLDVAVAAGSLLDQSSESGCEDGQ
jgi:hypothetical protein